MGNNIKHSEPVIVTLEHYLKEENFLYATKRGPCLEVFEEGEPIVDVVKKGWFKTIKESKSSLYQIASYHDHHPNAPPESHILFIFGRAYLPKFKEIADKIMNDNPLAVTLKLNLCSEEKRLVRGTRPL